MVETGGNTTKGKMELFIIHIKPEIPFRYSDKDIKKEQSDI